MSTKNLQTVELKSQPLQQTVPLFSFPHFPTFVLCLTSLILKDNGSIECMSSSITTILPDTFPTRRERGFTSVSPLKVKTSSEGNEINSNLSR